MIIEFKQLSIFMFLNWCFSLLLLTMYAIWQVFQKFDLTWSQGIFQVIRFEDFEQSIIVFYKEKRDSWF